jgi:hypothetical protein
VSAEYTLQSSNTARRAGHLAGVWQGRTKYLREIRLTGADSGVMFDRAGKDCFAWSRDIESFNRTERDGFREVCQEQRLMTFAPNDD